MHTTICSWVSTFIHPVTQPEEWIPLYTHPVKELTNEEILNIAHQIRLIDRQTADDGHLYFARAILKKAQEK